MGGCGVGGLWYVRVMVCEGVVWEGIVWEGVV